MSRLVKFISSRIFAVNESSDSFSSRLGSMIKYASIVSGFAHLCFAFIFMSIGVKEMVYFNLLISIPLVLLSYFMSLKGKNTLASFLFYMEVAVHAIAAIYFIGWESGFQFYLLASVILSQLAYGWKSYIRWSIFFSNLILFVLAFIFFKDSPQYELNRILLSFLYIINVFAFTLIASIYIFYFMNLVITFEKRMKIINEKLNYKNKLIEEQKDEIIAQRDLVFEQKNEIEKIHQEVTDSINYAQRIQKSILPTHTSLNENIKGLFVLFKPKSKVSGDFYWWTNIEKHTVITAADCTGHGVPGAFMSMLGISYLREIVSKEYITHPGVILRKLRKEVIKSLKQKGESMEQKDGMDLGLISINHETNIVQFAGANNPVYVISNNELKIEEATINTFSLSNIDAKLYEIKPDKMPIGIYRKMDKFTMHEFPIQKGDTIYLFSDGFADQFGGPDGKKFMYKPFKKLLLENSHKPLFEQKQILEDAYENWIGNLEQVDDIVVLGIQI